MLLVCVDVTVGHGIGDPYDVTSAFLGRAGCRFDAHAGGDSADNAVYGASTEWAAASRLKDSGPSLRRSSAFIRPVPRPKPRRSLRSAGCSLASTNDRIPTQTWIAALCRLGDRGSLLAKGSSEGQPDWRGDPSASPCHARSEKASHCGGGKGRLGREDHALIDVRKSVTDL